MIGAVILGFIAGFGLVLFLVREQLKETERW